MEFQMRSDALTGNKTKNIIETGHSDWNFISSELPFRMSTSHLKMEFQLRWIKLMRSTSMGAATGRAVNAEHVQLKSFQEHVHSHVDLLVNEQLTQKCMHVKTLLQEKNEKKTSYAVSRPRPIHGELSV